MLVTATYFWQVVLAIHIVVVIAAFGLLVSFPLITMAAERIDPRSMPVLLRARVMLGRGLVNPGLLVVAAAGVYLAAHLHLWHQFFVQWGIAAAVVLGALEGAYVIRSSKKLAVLADRDIEAAGLGDVQWSDEYLAARGRFEQVGAVMALIVIVTAYVMTVQ